VYVELQRLVTTPPCRMYVCRPTSWYIGRAVHYLVIHVVLRCQCLSSVKMYNLLVCRWQFPRLFGLSAHPQCTARWRSSDSANFVIIGDGRNVITLCCAPFIHYYIYNNHFWQWIYLPKEFCKQNNKSPKNRNDASAHCFMGLSDKANVFCIHRVTQPSHQLNAALDVIKVVNVVVPFPASAV